MRGGAVAGGRRRELRPPDGASCSRRVGLPQCKSFVEMCIVSCLSASPTCIYGRGAGTWGCPRCCLPCSRDSLAPLYHTNCGWLSFGDDDVFYLFFQKQKSTVVSSTNCLFAVELWRGVVSRLHLPGCEGSSGGRKKGVV